MCRNSNALNVDLARRMRATGVPMDATAFAEPLVVRQQGERLINSRYVISINISAVIIIYLRIIGNRSIPFILNGFELCLPWKNTPATLLLDPADPSAPQIYKFSPHDVSGYDKSEMIFQSGKTLRRGQLLKGYLLAHEPETIFDQFDEPHSSDLILLVDRSAEWGPKPAVREPRRRLFELSDQKIGHRPRNAKIVTGHGDLEYEKVLCE